MKKQTGCCWKCRRYELVNKDTIKEYSRNICINSKCKCHSPKVSKDYSSEESVSKGQEGEDVKGSSSQKSEAVTGKRESQVTCPETSQDFSPSSFDSVWEELMYVKVDERMRFKLLTELKSIVERDYMKKEDYDDLGDGVFFNKKTGFLRIDVKKIGEIWIEKQKVIDALKRADDMGFEKALIKWLKKELKL